MKRTQIYLKEIQYKRLASYSANKSISLSESIREMVDIGYEVAIKTTKLKQKKQNVGNQLLKSRDTVLFTGPKDLSKKVDKYVYGY